MIAAVQAMPEAADAGQLAVSSTRVVSSRAARIVVMTATAFACMGACTAAQADTTVAFDCVRAPRVTVHFIDDRAEVTLHDRRGRATPPRSLLQQPWASGFRYAGDGLVLVGKGRRIDLTSDRPGEAPRRCRAVDRPPT